MRSAIQASEHAEALYQEALLIAREINSPNDIAAYTGNLAALAIDRKDFLLAEKLARQALEQAKAVGRQESIAADYRRLAEALAGQGRMDEARDNALRAEEIYRRLGSSYQPYLELSRCLQGVAVTSGKPHAGETARLDDGQPSAGDWGERGRTLGPCMATFKLFISHSLRLRQHRDKPPRAMDNWRLLQETGRALESEYGGAIEILCDFRKLRPGDDWELRINQWLAECHGAIILFSRRAISESTQVKKSRDSVGVSTSTRVARPFCSRPAGS